MSGWEYAFDCRNCDQVEHIEDGDYCMAMRRGEVTIRADADRILRCDAYRPKKEANDGRR